MKKVLSEDRPWGNWRIIEEHAHYKIKAITVAPHQRLSLQLHHKRCEHWIVVQGKALITKDNKEILLKTYEHIDIPSETPHRITNNTDESVVIIEIQYGVCDENDIIRIEDDYGRS
ncbi:MAG: hypothetical protein A2Y62_07735 [Candidatus Fischerbacteria bacterium RBG_13_37_8]|uniref:Mannose-6-phosphate isomerase type II C-terminal domain-containing protein n=1 Tax=Candidatus Fischerbacteria bacterium RBG_13_37_8 TaxID=1817863 RepID=A0A1F5V924_9BACT|nr:MAG: hypothetical protein A2Y62_07735 [Candidatus Fischerbacteria bacterium RBG_13_37_8]